MSKYDALCTFLACSKQSQIQLSFLQIEKIIGSALPGSAYEHAAWWANGGHSQAQAWENAGFMTRHVDICSRKVVFCRQENLNSGLISPQLKKQKNKILKYEIENDLVLTICGYEFHFIQQLIPECENGKVKEYYPETQYENTFQKRLLPEGKGPFCRFSVHVQPLCGVYAWVVDREVIYIGETANLQLRFNNGYGMISPCNCYIGGQSTNCKMNKIVLECYKNKTPVCLYFYQTDNHKQMEWDLLHRITTRYNKKIN